MQKLLFILFAQLFSPILFAQNMPPPAHSSSPYYVPPGAQSGNGTNARSEIRWADRWGAIASSKSAQTIYGIASDKPSKKSAVSAALSECQQRGGNNCKVRTTYHNQCIAMALSESSSYSMTSAYENDAKKAVMEYCAKEEENNDACWYYYSGCSIPVRDN